MKRPRLETLINLALIVVAIAFVFSLISRYVKREATSGPRKPPTEIGAKIDLSGIEWGKSEATVLFVLSTKCPFCTDSMPFYKRLVQETKGRARFIGLFQQNESEARQYLQDNGLAIEDVRKFTPSQLGVSGVPTLILANQQGIVQDLWFGKIGANSESLVLKRIKGEAGNDGVSLNPEELQGIFARKEAVVVLNVDERDVYQREHFSGAINIPFDELESRMDDELKPDQKIIIYEEGPQKYSYEAFEILKNNGFKDVSVLRGGFQMWKASTQQDGTKR